MPQLSPGPWEYDAVAGTVYDETGRAMCDSVHAADADCRLIAAAPEMLQLLRDATTYEGRDELAVVLRAARSLIARLDNG